MPSAREVSCRKVSNLLRESLFARNSSYDSVDAHAMTSAVTELTEGRRQRGPESPALTEVRDRVMRRVQHHFNVHQCEENHHCQVKRATRQLSPLIVNSVSSRVRTFWMLKYVCSPIS